jgi:ferritin-like protein
VAYHEPVELLSETTRDLHRALKSLQEELEAIDWYSQRIEATSDAELAAVLTHNRDEEIEHAAMVLEWLRRRVPKFDSNLRKYLFTSSSFSEIAATEEEHEQLREPDAEAGFDASGTLGIGSLKRKLER